MVVIAFLDALAQAILNRAMNSYLVSSWKVHENLGLW